MTQNIRLKITKHDENHILLQARGQIDHFGFGTFLCDLKPSQIDADAFSKKALLSAKYQEGLSGLELWSDNRVAWGNPSESIVMPLREISKHEGADEWLKDIKGVNKCTIILRLFCTLHS